MALFERRRHALLLQGDHHQRQPNEYTNGEDCDEKRGGINQPVERHKSFALSITGSLSSPGSLDALLGNSKPRSRDFAPRILLTGDLAGATCAVAIIASLAAIATVWVTRSEDRGGQIVPGLETIDACAIACGGRTIRGAIARAAG